VPVQSTYAVVAGRLARWRSGQNSHIVDLVRGASVAGILKALAAILAFGLTVVLGRLLGPEGAGVYFLALTTVTIAATVGRVGLDSAVLRYVAAAASADNWTDVKRIYRSGIVISLTGSCSIAAILYFAADLLARGVFSDPDLADPIRIMAVAVVPLSLGVLISQALLGLSRIRDSILVYSILPTGVGLTATWILASLWHVNGAVVAYVIGVTSALAYAWFVWRRALAGRSAAPQLHQTESPNRALLKSGTPLLIGALLQLVIQTSGTFMLGIWSENADVSQFAVALRTATLIGFVLLAVKSIAQPKFAELHASGDRRMLAAMAHKSTLLMTACAAPVFLVFVAAPEFVMSAFGSAFTNGAVTLQILSVGQFINVATGAVGVLLVMSGHERQFRNTQVITAFVVLALNALLIPAYGAIGAASAATAALIVQNVLFSYFVWRKLRIVMFSSRSAAWPTVRDA
jgi:O-antigen/teichoic acid export membrane protein